MRLEKVKRGNLKLKCGCRECRRTISDISLMYADLDGLPYKSYYCQECVDNMKNRDEVQI